MKKSIYPVLVLILIVAALAGCRDGNAANNTNTTSVPMTTAGTVLPTENTTPATSTAPTNNAASTPTIDNGNGPLESTGNTTQNSTGGGQDEPLSRSGTGAGMTNGR